MENAETENAVVGRSVEILTYRQENDGVGRKETYGQKIREKKHERRNLRKLSGANRTYHVSDRLGRQLLTDNTPLDIGFSRLYIFALTSSGDQLR